MMHKGLEQRRFYGMQLFAAHAFDLLGDVIPIGEGIDLLAGSQTVQERACVSLQVRMSVS
jgi:hypothetical protein